MCSISSIRGSSSIRGLVMPELRHMCPMQHSIINFTSHDYDRTYQVLLHPALFPLLIHEISQMGFCLSQGLADVDDLLIDTLWILLLWKRRIKATSKYPGAVSLHHCVVVSFPLAGAFFANLCAVLLIVLTAQGWWVHKSQRHTCVCIHKAVFQRTMSRLLWLQVATTQPYVRSWHQYWVGTLCDVHMTVYLAGAYWSVVSSWILRLPKSWQQSSSLHSCWLEVSQLLSLYVHFNSPSDSEYNGHILQNFSAEPCVVYANDCSLLGTYHMDEAHDSHTTLQVQCWLEFTFKILKLNAPYGTTLQKYAVRWVLPACAC